MPTYDYRCEDNGRVVEVKHRLNETIATWAELCERAGIDPGTTPANTPVRRLATGGQVVSSTSLKDSVPPCASGTCGGGGCGFR